MREYVTISMRPGLPSRIEVAVYPGAEMHVYQGVISDHQPYVSVCQGEVTLSLSTDGPHVTAEDVDAARTLAQAFTAYLADCERLYDQNTRGDSHDDQCPQSEGSQDAA